MHVALSFDWSPAYKRQRSFVKNCQSCFKMQQDRFKLDAAAINITGAPSQRVVVYNFNIPLGRLEDVASFEQVCQKLETDFPPEANGVIVSPYFQLSAVYMLINSATNEERMWSGSFQPKGRDFSKLTDFQKFEPTTFLQYAMTHSNPRYVINKMDSFVNGEESLWRFSHLISVVISLQATLHMTHPLFVNRPGFTNTGRAGPNKKNWKVLTTFFD